MEALIVIIVLTVFVNNIVFSQFLGICPFLGVSNKISTAVGMSAAVVFVMTLATLATYCVYYYLLEPLQLTFLQTISYILIIAALVQMLEIILKKAMPPLYQALGIFLPLITTNCAVLGVAILVVQQKYTLAGSLIFSFFTAIGFGLALIIFAGIREQLDLTGLPKYVKGTPAALITAGILALAFMGFAGLVK
ncbi:MAG: RnfABCDGE type electron transport complex subunit A [Bacteroidales bacterium]|jgi:electron transport complex protein RnfA|nr:RnfABCDGE type electron transport complex subunit A [Bacteroidales bacterium]